jgi:DNA segregation ATPase FtsK/SpoIIIE, S-DNA-T family
MAPIDSPWQCTWRTGPDAGRCHPLAIGRHLVGRAHSAEVDADDPALQPHHLMLEARPDGVVLTQLTGRVPVRVNGHALDHAVLLGEGDVVEVGASTLLIERAADHDNRAAVRGDVLLRGPRSVPQWNPADLVPPLEAASWRTESGGLLPALLGVAGSAVIALVMRQPMFLLFGGLGGVAALASWGTQRVSGRRRHRRDRADAAIARAAFESAMAADRAAFLGWHHLAVPTAASALSDLLGRTSRLWTRRAHHPDAFSASVGTGDVPWRTTPIAHPHAASEPMVEPDLAVAASLGPGSRLAVQGPLAAAVARSVIAQLVASCGPADLRIVIVTEQPQRWDCLRGLPHLRLPDGSDAVVGAPGLSELLEQLDGDHRAHLLLLTDDVTSLGTRTSPLRRALHADEHALLAVLHEHDSVPQLCRSILSTVQGPVARWVADSTTTLLPVPVRVSGVGERAMLECTSALVGLQDPEDPLASAGRLPRDVSLADLFAADTVSMSARWSAHHDPPPRTQIGIAADGVVDIDLVRDGPHALIAGTTGAGKSELLRSLVLGLAAHSAPDHLTFVLIDYKGGAAFDVCSDLPHVVGTVTDLDDELADRALRSLHAELRRREALLREHRAADLPTLRTVAPHVVLPRLVVVIDEFAALVAEQPDFLHSLVGVAQRGRSLGVHLVLATQRPHGVISDDIRANTNLRIALRLHDPADALDVVGDRAPAQLPRSLPGRTVMRLGADECLTFQTARIDDSTAQQVVAGARELTSVPPPTPWQPPLPDLLSPADLPHGAIGWCDDPDHQQRIGLHWGPGAGSVLVCGSTGQGVSSTLHTLACQALQSPTTHVYVLLGRPDDRLAALATHPRCIVVAIQERERSTRLIHRLRTHIHRCDGTPVVLVVDGLDVVRRTLDDLSTLAELDALDDVLAHGDAGGVTVVCGAEQPAAIPATVVSRCAHRWVLSLHDPHDASVVGVAPHQVPRGRPGRAFVGELGLTAQLVAPGSTPIEREDDRTATPPGAIESTPPVVTADRLPPAAYTDATTLLPIGIGVADGCPTTLDLPDGDHVVVLGTSRSGRSTTLARLASAWRLAHPDGRVVAVLPRRSTFPAHLAHDVLAGHDLGSSLDTASLDTASLDTRMLGPLLVIVDDAELVDDPHGVLAAMAGSGRAGRTVVAAGRPEALRQSYGHWTTVLRRSRTGLVSANANDIDGDLLGAVLPRRLPVEARPGLAWLITPGAVALVQVALPDPAPSIESHLLAH